MEIRYNGEEIKLEDIVITWRDYKTGRFVSGDIEDYAEYKYNMGYETVLMYRATEEQFMKHTYTEEEKEKIAQMLFDFLREHNCFGGEQFAQDDTSQIDSIDFMCALADIKDVTED